MKDNVLEKALSKRDFILSRIKNLKDDDIIYLSGSILEGFGNASSDVDVFVICNGLDEDRKLTFNKETEEEEIAISTSQSLIHNFIVDDIRFDIEYWDIKDVHSLINKLNAINFSDDYHRTRLNNDEMDFIHRLKFGEPLFNKGNFKEILQNINFEKLSYIQAIIFSEQYSSFLEDIQGAMESEDLGTVYVLGDILLETSINQFLSINGETNPSRKWIYRKLKRLITENYEYECVLNNFLELKSYRFEPNTITQHIYDLVSFTQTINDNVQFELGAKQIY